MKKRMIVLILLLSIIPVLFFISENIKLSGYLVLPNIFQNSPNKIIYLDGETCGDGIIFSGEECDDANTQDGDGCSSICVVETGWACANLTRSYCENCQIIASCEDYSPQTCSQDICSVEAWNEVCFLETGSCITNVRPYFVNVPNTVYSVEEGTEFNMVLPWAVDPDGDSQQIEYFILSKPFHSSFNIDTHEFSWTPTWSSRNNAVDPFGYPADKLIYYRARDSRGATTGWNVYLNISNKNRPALNISQPIKINGSFFTPVAGDSSGETYGLQNGSIQNIWTTLNELNMNVLTSQAYGKDLDARFGNDSARLSIEAQNLGNSLLVILDNAQANNKKFLAEVHHPETVQIIKDHPALLGYMLPDEPDLRYIRSNITYYSPTNISRMAQDIRSIDQNHPIFLDLSSRFSSIARETEYDSPEVDQIYEEYYNIPDVFVFNYYPLSGINGQPEFDYVRIRGVIEEAREVVGDKKPVAMFIEGNYYSLPYWADDVAIPFTSNILRKEFSQAIQGGASQIIYYTAHQASGIRAIYDFSTEIKQDMPRIHETLYGGIQEIILTEEESNLTLTAQKNISLNYEFNPDNFVWEFSWNASGLGSQIRCDEYPEFCNLDNITLSHPGQGTHLVRLVATDADNYTALKYQEIFLVKNVSISPIVGEEGTGGGNGGGGGGGGEPGSQDGEEYFSGDQVVGPGQCEEVWQCGKWSECSGGIETRVCEDANSCGTEMEKPEETRECWLSLPAPSDIAGFSYGTIFIVSFVASTIIVALTTIILIRKIKK